jgi:hypothetical protein
VSKNLFWDSQDDTLERKDGLDTFSSVIEFVVATDDGQQNGNDFLDAEVSKGSQDDHTIKDFTAGLEFLGKNWQEFRGDDLAPAVAEISHDGDGVFLGGRETRAACGIQQIGNSHQGSLQQLLRRLNWARFQQILSKKRFW